jgi:hypothetical protein
MTPEKVDLAIRDTGWVLGMLIVRYESHFADPELAEVALCWCHFRETSRKGLLSLARDGWQPAHIILCDVAKFLTAFGDPLPLWLQEYVVFAANESGTRRSKRGQDPLTNLVRDTIITQAVDMVTHRHGFHPTRNIVTTAECGCSIVAKALQHVAIHMSEANVAAIWRKHRRIGASKPRRSEQRIGCRSSLAAR